MTRTNDDHFLNFKTVFELGEATIAAGIPIAVGAPGYDAEKGVQAPTNLSQEDFDPARELPLTQHWIAPFFRRLPDAN